MKPPSHPEVCPICGAAVPDGAVACRECGSDDRTGWSEAARYDGLGLPDEVFDYGEFVEREFGSRLPRRRWGRFWWAVTLLLLAVWLWVWCGIR